MTGTVFGTIDGQEFTQQEYESLYDLIMEDGCDTRDKAIAQCGDLAAAHPKWTGHFASLKDSLNQISDKAWDSFVIHARQFSNASQLPGDRSGL